MLYHAKYPFRVQDFALLGTEASQPFRAVQRQRTEALACARLPLVVFYKIYMSSRELYPLFLI